MHYSGASRPPCFSLAPDPDASATVCSSVTALRRDIDFHLVAGELQGRPVTPRPLRALRSAAVRVIRGVIGMHHVVGQGHLDVAMQLDLSDLAAVEQDASFLALETDDATVLEEPVRASALRMTTALSSSKYCASAAATSQTFRPSCILTRRKSWMCWDTPGMSSSPLLRQARACAAATCCVRRETRPQQQPHHRRTDDYANMFSHRKHRGVSTRGGEQIPPAQISE